MSKYVEGYGRDDAYDGPYHPSANFDPAVAFANAGDPRAAAKAQKKNDLTTKVKEETQEFADALNNKPEEPNQFLNAGDTSAAADENKDENENVDPESVKFE